MAARRGRPAAPTYIVPVRAPANTLHQLELKFRQLVLLTQDNLRCIRWLAEHSLIANTMNCNNCNVAMSFQRREGQDYIDCFAWSCSKCRRHKSLRVGSFFQGSHLPLSKLLNIIYFWSIDVRQNIIAEQTGVSLKTIIDWENYIRDVCTQYVIDHTVPLGGQGLSVEIDESKFMHRKHHKGLYQEGHWVLGMIEQGSDRSVMIPVQDRSAATLLPVIRQHVLPGTRIITNRWASYTELPNPKKHRLNFVDPNDPTVHPSQIEGCWAFAKTKFGNMHGTTDELFPTYLQEFIWRKQHKENAFGNILFWISVYFNV